MVEPMVSEERRAVADQAHRRARPVLAATLAEGNRRLLWRQAQMCAILPASAEPSKAPGYLRAQVKTQNRGSAQDVRLVPAYTVADAARYLSMPYATLRSWFAGIEGQFKAVVHWEVSGDHRLSFSNLVEAHVLRALRTKHGISMPNVRKAIRYVEEKEGIHRLLLHQGLRAGLGRLFLQKYAELIELAPSTQHVIERALEQFLEAVVQDPVGVPAKLYPWIPDPRVGPKRSVVIDPEVSFGRPVTSLRGITTVVLADQFDAGASIEDLADDYGLAPEAIEDALAFERAAA